MQKRIEKISSFFKGFNITDGIAYIYVVFPNTWQLPNSAVLSDNFKASIASDDSGVYFFTQYTNGIDLIFDAVDFVIEFNRDLEAKTALFKEKVEELKSLFTTETTEALSTLVIEIKEPKKKSGKKTRNVKKKKTEDCQIECAAQCSEEPIKDETTIEEVAAQEDCNNMIDYIINN